MRLQKIIQLFKRIEEYTGSDQTDFIEFITKEIPSLWDAFQKSRLPKVSSDPFEDDGTKDPYPEHRMD